MLCFFCLFSVLLYFAFSQLKRLSLFYFLYSFLNLSSHFLLFSLFFYYFPSKAHMVIFVFFVIIRFLFLIIVFSHFWPRIKRLIFRALCLVHLLFFQTASPNLSSLRLYYRRECGILRVANIQKEHSFKRDANQMHNLLRYGVFFMYHL